MKLCLVLLVSLFVLCASLALATTDPRQRLRECQQQCERQEGRQKTLCHLRCEMYDGEEEEPAGPEDKLEQDENPYVFEEEHFSTRVEGQHGKISVLQKFDEKSKLLRGLENYRVAILEADPQTFVSPSHWDTDALLFVANGEGTITMIEENRRKSYSVEYGDVIRVRAGTPIYFISTHDYKKLVIIKLIHSVNLPGECEGYPPAGDMESESFYEAFSWDLLEAAFNIDRTKVEQVIKQKHEMIVRASREQIQAMMHYDQRKGGAIWPFGSESSGPFNLLGKRPVHSNKYGQLFEATPNEHKDQLKDLNLGITLTNITRGSHIGPYYNSRATKIAIVIEGEGQLEMACPHVSRASQEQEKREGQRFTKIRATLRRGTVFIVPAGHPVAAVASENSNLNVVSFEVNVEGNTRMALAGRNNVVTQWEDEAKELAFGVQAREVDRVFESQSEEFFFPGQEDNRDETELI